MVKRIVGYEDDNKTKIVFEREARDYDRSLANSTFGITISDIFRVAPVFIACAIFYFNTIQFREYQMDFNKQIVMANERQDRTIENVALALSNLNNYLSATTGKRFKNGEPL